MNKTLQIQKVKEFIDNKTDFDSDTIDVEHHVDSSLSLTENLNQIKSLLLVTPLNTEKAEQEIKEEYYKHIQEEREKELEKIKNSSSPDIDKYFSKLEKFINVLLKSKNTCLFELGDPALGKSYNTIRILKKENVPFKSKSGNITPLELYNFLYEIERSEAEVVIFDDTQSLVANVQSMSLLMEAMWSIDNIRMLNWNSSTKKLIAPKEFQFTKKIIFIMNDVPNTVMMDVLLTRTIVYDINFDYKTRINLMYEIAKLKHEKLNTEQRMEIVDFIKDNSDESTLGLNLRLQKKIEEIYIYEKESWKDLGLILMKKDENLREILSIINNSVSMKEAEKLFIQKGLGSRATFYRYKKRLGL